MTTRWEVLVVVRGGTTATFVAHAAPMTATMSTITAANFGGATEANYAPSAPDGPGGPAWYTPSP